ncbi:hypothetical protein HDU96_010518 [Phlyctochytrium bullatum]|nr:hypothetical protein HDU96_010518 [Phlyctochytrium bullatum]
MSKSNVFGGQVVQVTSLSQLGKVQQGTTIVGGRGPGTSTVKSAKGFQCQRCYQFGHFTYECKNERVYLSRPSRSQMVSLPPSRTLRPTNPDNLTPEQRKGLADKILKQKQAQRKRKGLDDDDSSSSSSSDSDSDSSSSSDESDGEGGSDSSSSSDSSDSSESDGSSSSSDSESDSSESDSEDEAPKKKQKTDAGK